MSTLSAVLNRLNSENEDERLQGLAVLVKSGNPKAIPFIVKVAQGDPSPRLRYIAKKGIEHIRQIAQNGKKSRDGKKPSSTDLKSDGAPQPGASAQSANKPEAGLSSEKADNAKSVEAEEKKVFSSDIYDEPLLQGQSVAESYAGEIMEKIKAGGKLELDDVAGDNADAEAMHIPSPEAASLDLELLKSYLEKAEDTQEVIYAARAVKEFDLQEFLPYLRALLPQSRVTDPQALATIVSSVGFFGDHQDLELMQKLIKHTDPRVRANAVEALESIGDPSAVSLIVPLLSDRDNRIRANAVSAMKRFGDETVFTVLKDMASSGEENMADSAAYALALFDSDKSVNLLDKLASSPVPTVAKQARKSLEKLKNKGNRTASDVLARIAAADQNEPEGDVFDKLMALRNVKVEDSIDPDSIDVIDHAALPAEKLSSKGSDTSGDDSATLGAEPDPDDVFAKLASLREG